MVFVGPREISDTFYRWNVAVRGDTSFVGISKFQHSNNYSPPTLKKCTVCTIETTIIRYFLFLIQHGSRGPVDEAALFIPLMKITRSVVRVSVFDHTE